MWAEWEGVASGFLDAAGIGAPVDPWLIAWALDLDVRAGPRGCRPHLLGSAIYVDADDRRERQSFAIAHECAHVLLRRAGLADTERACNAVASCLLLPRIDFERDRRATGGCLFELRERHPFASHEAIVRRLVAVAAFPSVAWIEDHDGPKRHWTRATTPGLRWPFRRPTPPEREAMDEALAAGTPVESLGGVRAWPVIEPGRVRVISLADTGALGA